MASTPEPCLPGQAVFLDALSAFPAFAETVQLAMTDWVRANAKLLLRFQRDRVTLMQGAGTKDHSNAGIASVRPGLSDPHDGCQTVTEVLLGDGAHVIYKPRSCSGEALWNRTLDWINREGFQPTLRVLQITTRKGYGWVQFLKPQPCDSMDAVRRAYHRWGALAAVAEALQCVDLHHENWMTAGEHPILVDAEAYGEDAWRLRRRDGRRYTLPSYLRTGLFPMRKNGAVPEYRGTAPFDALSAFKTPPRAWPVYATTLCVPQDFIDDIVTGYAAMFGFLHSRKSRTRRIAEFAAQATRRPSNRLFVRATAEYQQMLQQSLDDVELFGAQTRYETLFERCSASAPSEAIAAAEAAALLRCSIPRFTNAAFPYSRAYRSKAHPNAAGAIRRRLLTFR